MSAPYKRSIKLIRPRLQLKLVGGLASVALLALLLQFLLFMSVLAHVAVRLPNDGLVLMERVNSMLLWTAAVSVCVLLPLLFWVGISLTHRIAGPVFRMERFLLDVREGRQIDECRLRRGDELNELAARINETTQPLREANARRAADRQAA